MTFGEQGASLPNELGLISSVYVWGRMDSELATRAEGALVDGEVSRCSWRVTLVSVAAGYPPNKPPFRARHRNPSLSRAGARLAQLRPREGRHCGGAEPARASPTPARELRSAPCQGREKSKMTTTKILYDTLIYKKLRWGWGWGCSVFYPVRFFVHSSRGTPQSSIRSRFTSAP